MSDSIRMNEGPVQRGNGNGEPSTPKPVILPKGQASARAALAEQPGEGPSESDVAELFYRYMGAGPGAGFENAIAEALSRWGHQPARLRNCPTHGQQPPEAWGCPECVRELREELHRTVPVQPTPPAEGEVAEFITQLKSYAEYGTPIRLIPFVITRAAVKPDVAAKELGRIHKKHPHPTSSLISSNVLPSCSHNRNPAGFCWPLGC